MKRALFVLTAALLFLITPVYAETPDLSGTWVSYEFRYNDIIIADPVLNAAGNSNNGFLIILEIREDNTCSLYIRDTVCSAIIMCSDKEIILSVSGEHYSLKEERNGFCTLILSEDLSVILQKTEKKLDFSNAVTVEDLILEEEHQTALRKEIAEATAHAAKKTASVYDLNVLFSDADTARMSAYMNYARYYLDGNTMIGMAYDKSGFLPNFVKCTIETEGNTPKQDVFTVLDRHVNANFLTAYENQLYFVRVDRDSELASLARLDLQSDRVTQFGPEMHEMAFLQIHDGRIWYTGDEHRLYSCKIDGKDNRVEMDKAVYDPYFLTEDWLLYQNDADGETLHIRYMKDGTDLRITDNRSFNPIVNGTFLFFTSIPNDGGKAFLSRIDLSRPLNDGDMCFEIDKSDLPMSRSFVIFDSILYGENNSSAKVSDWKNMTNTAWLAITQQYFYVGEQYIVYGEMYTEHSTVSNLYLLDKKTEEKTIFRHVY